MSHSGLPSFLNSYPAIQQIVTRHLLNVTHRTSYCEVQVNKIEKVSAFKMVKPQD